MSFSVCVAFKFVRKFNGDYKMIQDRVTIDLPNGLQVTLYRKTKPTLSKGENETLEALWQRLGDALHDTDWEAVRSVYGKRKPALNPV